MPTSFSQIVVWIAEQNWAALIPYLSQQLLGLSTVANAVKANPNAPASTLISTIEGDFKHQWREQWGAFGWLVDVLWAYQPFTAALQVAIADQIASEATQTTTSTSPTTAPAA